MIIVKTNNGAKFVNEKEAVIVCHHPSASVAECVRMRIIKNKEK